MSFASPWAFYLFALAGGVILLYFLRRRARPYPVSALFLWEEMERQERRAWRLARHSILNLLLQLLALACLVLALAGPASPTAGTPGRLALILDGSASMQAVQGGKSRYELAVERAAGLLSAASGEVTVIQAQRHPRLLVPLTSDKRLAEAAVRGSEPTLEGKAKLEELLALLESQAPLAQFQRIVYLTDHEPAGLREGLPLEIELIGREVGVRNLGLLAFSIRAEPDPAAGYGVFVRARNYSAREERAILTIAADGELLLSRELELAPDEDRALAFSFARPLPSYAIAALEPQARDDFPWDDRRYFASPTSTGKVLWLGEEDRFLRGALLALGDFTITRDSREGGFDLIVANGVEVPPELEGNLLLVKAAFPPRVRLLGVEELPPTIEIEAEDHPLLEGVEPANFIILRAVRAILPPGGQALLRAGDLPLLYLKQEQERKICYFGFDLHWSNLGLTVDFPILMRNLLAWLLESPISLEKGLDLALELEEEVGDPLPAGEWALATEPVGRSYEPSPGLNPGRLSEQAKTSMRATLPGLYRLEEEGLTGSSYKRQRLLAVNLAESESAEAGLSPGEGSTTAMALEAAEAGAEAEAEAKVTTWARPVWAGFALGGLIFLVLEALSYGYEGLVWPRLGLRPRRKSPSSSSSPGLNQARARRRGQGRRRPRSRW
jgi:hypothetical protein